MEEKMSFFIVVANRLEKILGTFTKILAYPFHFILPKKRFTIPLISKAKINSSKVTKIPKIIWQTNYTNEVSLPVYINYLFNRLMSLDYEYHYVSTEDRLSYIKEIAPKDIFEAYEKLTDGASQADFWRLFVLDKEGGIYMDIDAHFVWPLSRMIQKSDEEVFLLNKEHFTNYFIATTPNNTIIQKCIELIVDNIENKRLDRGVYELTGPGVLNIAIGNENVNHRFYRVTCIQGSFTNEHFQYIDKPRGKWTYAKNEDLLR
jgi:mannosyltransferase OCH1-like enzyme